VPVIAAIRSWGTRHLGRARAVDRSAAS